MDSTGDVRQIVHRSGAAARRANVAPATLRVWERRYAVVDPQRSPSGQRLYKETDVERLKLLKRLVDRGYAIGTVARLSLEQLEFLTRAADSSAPMSPMRAPVRWVVVGKVMGERLKQFAPSIRVQDIYEGLSAAVESATSVDILLVHSPSLREEAAEAILGLVSRNPQACVAVIYSFGVASAVNALRSEGVRLQREPMNRVQLVQLVDELSQTAASRDARSDEPAVRPTRLFTDRELAMIERHRTSITCECPAHLTGLIAQLAAFEAYSDDCSARDDADAVLHRHMGDAASQARAMFESLLQRVAAQEGWLLDRPP